MTRVMKDSGIEWIGSIPEDWKIIPLRWTVIDVNEKNNPIKFINILSLTNKKGVIPYEDKGAQGNISKEDLTQYKIAYKNTIIINSMNLKIGSVGLSNYDGCVSPIYYVLRSKENTEIRFVNYLFQSEFQNYLGKYGKGILEIREKIPMYDVLHSYIPFPKIQKQQMIADFLDKKCELIDSTIEKNRKAIELMEEYKKIIFKVETQKYDCIIIKLKFLLKKNLQYGANSAGILYDVNLPRYIRITDIDNDLGLKNDNKLSLSEEEAKEFILNAYDILFARSGATVGKTFIYKENYERSAFAGYLIRATFDNSDLAEYVYNYTNSAYYEEWKNSVFIQSTIQNIGADKYSVMPVIIPTKKNNLKFINIRIRNREEKINIIIEYRKKIIDKLEEYKKSLIYETVTGKIEV